MTTTQEEMQSALETLAATEAFYRDVHDRFGDGHLNTGHAWDAMRRAGDKARALISRAQAEASAAPTMREALDKLLTRYRALVLSGDCGFWDPEEEAEVIAARAALKGGK